MNILENNLQQKFYLEKIIIKLSCYDQKKNIRDTKNSKSFLEKKFNHYVSCNKNFFIKAYGNKFAS